MSRTRTSQIGHLAEAGDDERRSSKSCVSNHSRACFDAKEPVFWHLLHDLSPLNSKKTASKEGTVWVCSFSAHPASASLKLSENGRIA